MDSNKIIIVSLITLILVVFLVCVLIVDIPLLGVSSIKTVISKRDEVIAKEAQLLTLQNSYSDSLKNLENAKTSYSKQKQIYESISEETINMIKEANIVENYSIEYMWIKLGNYAKRNNLTIVMVEPGNATSTGSQQTGDASVVEGNSTNTTSSSKSDVLQIEVTGSYINLSDFIFEVENDSELKFKLDNISMQYVGGTTIRTTFDVKNIKINK